MELYYGVSGSGAILHTINPRMHPDQLAYVINHANDKARVHCTHFVWRCRTHDV